MQFLIVVACALAVASAHYVPLAYSYYPHHVPVIDHNGVPVETPEVQHAKAAHFAAHAEANARTGLYPVAPLAHQVYGIPAVTHNALPLDTPEVAQAKLQHYHDYAVAAQRNGVSAHYIAPTVHAVPQVPADNPEVAIAKAQHFAAHAAARGHLRKRRALYAYGQHVPAIVNGVPVDTPEVQLAKAAHFAAHAEAKHGLSHVVHAYAPQHVPVIHDGVPVDTPEVQHAKVAHFAAHAEALGRSGHYYGPLVYAAPWGHYYGQAVIGPDGHPVETPEVQHAKAAHFAAHAAARHY